MKDKLKQLLKRFNNFYLLFGAVFIVWMLFFDSNDMYDQYLLHKKIDQLEQDRKFYKQNIVELKKEMKELQTSPKQLEKFAREKYKMKKPKEDVFVIVTEE
jgi:cell division protein DivIC